MRKLKTTIIVIVAFVMLVSIQVKAQVATPVYAPSFRYAPDRDYDLAWENDLVAFRIYGKQPSADAGLSGVDCWHKKVSYPITDKWYKGRLKGISYHEDHGEGCDQYHVGKTRGCGGIGIWKDNKILSSRLYESWEVVSQTQTSLSFKVVYSWILDGERIVETRVITIENGSQLYSAVSHFTKNGFPIVDLEIAIGISTQNATAEVSLNEELGYIAAWHALGKPETGMIGTGAIVDTKYLVTMLEQKSENQDESNALAIVKTDSNGAIKWQAGFAWEKASNITSHNQWNNYLSKILN